MTSVLKKTLLYLGLGSDEDFADYDDERREEVAPRRRDDPTDPRDEAPPRRSGGHVTRPVAAGGTGVVRPVPAPEPERNAVSSVVRPLPAASTAKPHVVTPLSFNDAQEVGDRFKEKLPVIVNLQASDHDLTRRLIDFASGLCYGLGGRMERVADHVYLLTPNDVHVSADDRRRLQSGDVTES